VIDLDKAAAGVANAKALQERISSMSVNTSGTEKCMKILTHFDMCPLVLAENDCPNSPEELERLVSKTKRTILQPEMAIENILKLARGGQVAKDEVRRSFSHLGKNQFDRS